MYLVPRPCMCVIVVRTAELLVLGVSLGSYYYLLCV